MIIRHPKGSLETSLREPRFACADVFCVKLSLPTINLILHYFFKITLLTIIYHFIDSKTKRTKRRKIMTKEEFIYLIETKQNLEFSYNGKTYNLTYDKDESGNQILIFGQLYEGKKYDSIGELLNEAKIENHFFKDMLDIL